MKVARRIRGGFVVWSLTLAGCAGERMTPLASPADFAPVPARGGWTVANTFGEVSLEKFQSGEVVIIPIKAVGKPGAERYDTHRSAYTYETDIPDPNVRIDERYAWGAAPTNNGHGTFHYHDERLAFDLKSHRVFVLPRGGMTRVDRKSADGSQFWCSRDALNEATVAIDSYTHSDPHVACPTAFLRWTGENSGPPILIGLQKEVFVIDAHFVAELIAELHLDEEVGRVKAAEDMNRTISTVARLQEDQQRLLEAERIRTAGARGQASIDRQELGVLLCSDVQVRNTQTVVSAFLESVHAEKVQLRVNNVRSLDGRTTFTALRIEGIDYTPGNIVWSNRREWRACE